MGTRPIPKLWFVIFEFIAIFPAGILRFLPIRRQYAFRKWAIKLKINYISTYTNKVRLEWFCTKASEICHLEKKATFNLFQFPKKFWNQKMSFFQVGKVGAKLGQIHTLTDYLVFMKITFLRFCLFERIRGSHVQPTNFESSLVW